MQVSKVAQLTGHNASIFALIEGQDERRIFTAAGDGWVVEWDLDTPDLGKLVAKVDRQVFSLCFLRNEQKIVAGNMDGGVHWIDLNVPDSTKNIGHHQRGVFEILEANGSVFTAGGDGKLSRWSISEMQSTESYHLANQALRCIFFCEKRQELAVGGSDGAIYMLDVASLELRHKITAAHASSVFSIQYSPDGNSLLSGGRDAHLKVWDLENNFEEISSQPAHLFTINSISFSPDRQYFATASRDKTVKIWNASNYELIKVLEGGRDGGHFNSVNRVLWSKHQNMLVSCSDDRTCILWKVIA
ncbi:MAG: WD40 repeat domain-containing protein [Bacteroidetes bacterium]|nr:WD40 repeat domain-containing protein [Bacteroidota bacterium]